PRRALHRQGRPAQMAGVPRATPDRRGHDDPRRLRTLQEGNPGGEAGIEEEMITYKKAGVDIDAGNELVRRIKKMAPRIGGFSDGMPLPPGLKQPVLIGCTDGVGTKLAIAQSLGRHDTIGYDLVGMNVNDLICSGA